MDMDHIEDIAEVEREKCCGDRCTKPRKEDCNPVGKNEKGQTTCCTATPAEHAGICGAFLILYVCLALFFFALMAIFLATTDWPILAPY